MKKYSYSEALHRVAMLCSRGEKSIADIRRKLSDWGIESEEAEQILNYLKENHFVDDERFAVAFVKDKARFSRWGRVKIAYALRQKAISENTIESALQQLDIDEYTDRLMELLRAKSQKMKYNSDYERNTKLMIGRAHV